jgi:hypothetical protein
MSLALGMVAHSFKRLRLEDNLGSGVPDQPGTFQNTQMQCVVVYTYTPSYLGRRNNRTEFQGQPG